MKIGEICKSTGLTVRTIRFYIEEGLIAPAKSKDKFSGRSSLEFAQRDLEDLEEIAALRQASLTLSEIKTLRANRERVVEFALQAKQLLAADLEQKSKIYEAIGFVDESLTYEQFLIRLRSVRSSDTPSNRNIGLPKFRIAFWAALAVAFLFTSYINLLVIGLGSPIGFSLLSGIAIGVLILSAAGAVVSFLKPRLGFIYVFIILLILALISFGGGVELGFWTGVYMLGICIYFALYLLQLHEQKMRLEKR